MYMYMIQEICEPGREGFKKFGPMKIQRGG